MSGSTESHRPRAPWPEARLLDGVALKLLGGAAPPCRKPEQMIFGWYPGIGDPTIVGWLTVAFYLGAAWLAGRAAQRSWGQRQAFWCTAAVAMVLLAINKQLDLQSLITAVGREVAHRGRWYEDRRVYQREFIVAVGIAALGAIGLLALLSKRFDKGQALASVGLVWLLAFIVVRAASFHHIDYLLRSALSGATVNHIMEIGGIAIVAAGAGLSRRRCPSIKEKCGSRERLPLSSSRI